jgi:hypothetical protein
MTVLLQRIWIQITSDRKRFAALCAAVVLGLLLWSRIILISNVPRTAVAGPERDGVTGEKQKDGAAKPVNPAPPRRVALDRQPRRDPFGIHPEAFRRSASSSQIPEVPGKSAAREAEDSVAAARQWQSMLKAQAARYRLEGVMAAGDLAVINGRVYAIGMVIAQPDQRSRDSQTWKALDDRKGQDARGDSGRGAMRPPAPTSLPVTFRLHDVWPKSVIIEADGHCFELTLEHPQTSRN